MSLKENTKKVQSELADYVRSGELRDIEGARTDRLHNYRRLVYNVVNGALKQAYPIAVSILSENEWEQLVNDFFTRHDPRSSQVWKMPYELFEYVSHSNYGEKLDRPYLEELLYFEWKEIEIHAMEDVELPATEHEQLMPDNACIVNPYHEILHFNYPVHKKSWKELEQHKGNYFVLVYRNLSNYKVQFMELSPLAALLVEQLSSEVPVQEAFSMASDTFKVDAELMHEKGMEMLNNLKKHGVILGSKSSP